MNELLEEVRATLKSCQKCDLSLTRSHIVFGSGNPCARIMLIGEAPGKNEDATGEPFVGAAGKRLDALLEKAQLQRKDIFIGNVVKCRPPKNRNPKTDEIAACSAYLDAQMQAIAPHIVVPLGTFAAQHVLHTTDSITHLRGTLHYTTLNTFEGAKTVLVFPVFHPAAAIYDSKKQAILEEDFETLGTLLLETNELVNKD